MTNRLPHTPDSGDLLVLAVKRAGQTYVLMYETKTASDALRALGNWASNPELCFTWYDAALCSQKIRQTVHGGEL